MCLLSSVCVGMVLVCNHTCAISSSRQSLVLDLFCMALLHVKLLPAIGIGAVMCEFLVSCLMLSAFFWQCHSNIIAMQLSIADCCCAVCEVCFLLRYMNIELYGHVLVLPAFVAVVTGVVADENAISTGADRLLQQ